MKKKTYQKPTMTTANLSFETSLLTGSYDGEKGGITDEPGDQEDFPVKEQVWGDLW